MLNKFARVQMKVATATSAYIMGMITAGGLIRHFSNPFFSMGGSSYSSWGVKVGAWAEPSCHKKYRIEFCT